MPRGQAGATGWIQIGTTTDLPDHVRDGQRWQAAADHRRDRQVANDTFNETTASAMLTLSWLRGLTTARTTEHAPAIVAWVR